VPSLRVGVQYVQAKCLVPVVRKGSVPYTSEETWTSNYTWDGQVHGLSSEWSSNEAWSGDDTWGGATKQSRINNLRHGVRAHFKE
jgi:hypothetical protein